LVARVDFKRPLGFFCKNDEKNDLETLYDFTTNLLEEKCKKLQ